MKHNRFTISSVLVAAACICSPALAGAEQDRAARTLREIEHRPVSPAVSQPKRTPDVFAVSDRLSALPLSGPLFDNGPPDGSNGLSNFQGTLSGTPYDRTLADDFNIECDTSATIEQVRISGVWFDGSGAPGPLDGIRVRIWADDGTGKPTTPISNTISDQQDVSFSATNTGGVYFGRPEVLYIVNLDPVTLDCNAWYWISIQPTGTTDNFFQLTSAASEGLIGNQIHLEYPDFGAAWPTPGYPEVFAEPYDVTFQLEGTIATSGCGDPESGSCCEANSGPYCENAECCELICAQDPFCCGEFGGNWDSACAAAASQQCEICQQTPEPFGCHYDSGATTAAGAWSAGGTLGWMQRYNAFWCGERLLAIATTFGSAADPNPAGVNPGDPVGYAIFADTGEGPGEVLWQGLATIEAEAIKTDVPQYLEVPNIKVSGTFYVAVWVWHEAPSQPDGGFPAPMDQSIVMADDAWLFGSPEVPFEQFDPNDPAQVYNMAEIGWPTSWLLRSVGEPAVEMCLGDLNGDGVVDGADLGALLAQWGPCADCDDCPADLNGDCQVDGADLGTLLANWGECPETEPSVKILMLPHLSFEGEDCPDNVTATVDNAIPGTQVVIYYGYEEGEYVIPEGQPCEGTVLDVHEPEILGTARANAQGKITIEVSVPEWWCEGEPPKPRLRTTDGGCRGEGRGGVGYPVLHFPGRCKWSVECRLEADAGTCKDVLNGVILNEIMALPVSERVFSRWWCFGDADCTQGPFNALLEVRYMRWDQTQGEFVTEHCTLAAKISLHEDGCGATVPTRFSPLLPLGQGPCEKE